MGGLSEQVDATTALTTIECDTAVCLTARGSLRPDPDVDARADSIFLHVVSNAPHWRSMFASAFAIVQAAAIEGGTGFAYSKPNGKAKAANTAPLPKPE